MGFFSKSEEEKRKEKKRKLKEQQKQAEIALKKLGVNFKSYSDKKILENIKNDFCILGSCLEIGIIGEMVANVNMTSYQRISSDKLTQIILYNRIIVRQNELMIRRLEKIIDVFKKK